MNRIIIMGRFPFLPGKSTEGADAARVLKNTVTREHSGVQMYEFFVTPDRQEMAIIEAYETEAALIAHIDASDFTGLFSALDIAAGTIQIHGRVSPALREKLKTFGHIDLFVSV